MEKKDKSKFDEGVVKGKKVFFLGALPVFFFLVIAGGSAYFITTFTNKFTVNKDDNVCNAVRRSYASSVKTSWPCETTDKGEYVLVTFDQSSNTGQASALMSFKYIKSTKTVEPAININ
jgi:hypothetical protein